MLYNNFAECILNQAEEKLALEKEFLKLKTMQQIQVIQRLEENITLLKFKIKITQDKHKKQSYTIEMLNLNNSLIVLKALLYVDIDTSNGLFSEVLTQEKTKRIRALDKATSVTKLEYDMSLYAKGLSLMASMLQTKDSKYSGEIIKENYFKLKSKKEVEQLKKLNKISKLDTIYSECKKLKTKKKPKKKAKLVLKTYYL